jgi:predicted dehydrogenase
MLAETRPDVAVVMTPHPFHAEIAIACLRAGCHVLVEKPMAVQVAEADRMIDAASAAGRVLAVNFQSRHRPEVRRARELVANGSLGKIQRVELVATWTRTAAYYAAAPWRGTWTGEGGGILMNQAPHQLDLLCYLLGPPRRVVGWTRTLLQPIETEDTAQAMLEWPEGALGTLHVTTAEAGEPEHFEIVGTGGVLRLRQRAGSGQGSELTVETFEPDLRDHIANDPRPYSAPTIRPLPVEPEAGTGDHAAVYRDLHAAIREGRPPAASGADGRMSLELANAIIYSGQTGAEVTLPLDREAYAALLDRLRAGRPPTQ